MTRPLAQAGRVRVRTDFRRLRPGRQQAGLASTLSSATSEPVVALLVPFREQKEQDRWVQLAAFEAHMAGYLRGALYIIVVVEQSDDGRAFNRGALLNVGFVEAKRRLSLRLASAVFHDVDLLPSEGLLSWYSEPPLRQRPSHIAGPSTWGKYDMPGYEQVFFGGVTALHPCDFEAANGYPNNYWGWGAEDDQLRLRVQASGGLARGVARPTSGTGSFHDLDGIAMLSLLASRESAMRHAHKFNPLLFNGEPRRLDSDWASVNGLNGLRYDARSRKSRRLSAHVEVLHVVAHLGAT